MSSTTAASGTSLRGRIALITGASRGIGLECARALYAAEARLVLVGRDLERMSDHVKKLSSSAPDKTNPMPISAHRFDLAFPEDVPKLASTIRELLGRSPDILVNNAGQFFLAPVEQMSLDDFERTIRVNLTSQFALVREFLPDMRSRRRGHIVTIGSIADHRAFPENAAYAASKFGARALHQVLREELRGSGVRASLLSPGPTDTALWDDINPDVRAGFTPRAEMLSASAVAEAVRFVVTQPDDVNIDELRLSRA